MSHNLQHKVHPTLRRMICKTFCATGLCGLPCRARQAEQAQTPYRKQEEHLGQLPLLEVVGQVLHRVRPHARDVAVLAGVLAAQRPYPLLDVRADLVAQLHAHHQGFGVQRGEPA